MRTNLSTRIENLPDTLTFDARKIIARIVRRLWLVILAAIISAGACCYIASCHITPMYESTAQVYVAASGSELSEDYARIVTSRSVLEEVIENLNLSCSYDELKADTTASTPSSGHILEISVRSISRTAAQTICREVCAVACEQLETFTGTSTIRVIDAASMPADQASPDVAAWTARGALGGAAVSFLLLVLAVIWKNIFEQSRPVSAASRYKGNIT